MLCITVAKEDTWANVIGSKVICVSKHVDYVPYHWKAKDVKALKLPLTKFIFVNSAGVVDEVILADQLAARGSNFKTAKRNAHPLTDEEQWEIAAAIELVQGAGASTQQAERAADLERTPPNTEAAQLSDTTPPAEASSNPENTASQLDGASSAVGPASEAATTDSSERLDDLETLAADEADLDEHAAPAIKGSRLSNKKKRR